MNKSGSIRGSRRRLGRDAAGPSFLPASLSFALDALMQVQTSAVHLAQSGCCEPCRSRWVAPAAANNLSASSSAAAATFSPMLDLGPHLCSCFTGCCYAPLRTYLVAARPPARLPAKLGRPAERMDGRTDGRTGRQAAGRHKCARRSAGARSHRYDESLPSSARSLRNCASPSAADKAAAAAAARAHPSFVDQRQ